MKVYFSSEKSYNLEKESEGTRPPLTLPPPLLGAWVFLSLFIPEEEAIK